MASPHVQRILASHNYYELLRLTPAECEAGSHYVEAAYARLAEQVHPEHCRDPRAREAFALLEKARVVLRDPMRRADYDIALPQLRHPLGQVRIHRAPPRAAEGLSFHACLWLPIVIGIYLLPWLWSTFSSGITRDKLKGVLQFEATPGVQWWQGRSPRYHVSYFVPLAWLEGTLGGGMAQSEFEQRLGRVADELWLEHLTIQCEVEKNVIGREGRQCAKRQRCDE
jgi:hypothetical protein